MTDLPSTIWVLIAGLAVARITALIVHDSLLDPIRHRIFTWSPPTDDPASDLFWYTLPNREPGFFGRLLSCHHCIGVWVAGGTYAAFQAAPVLTGHVAIVAALAQISDLAIKASRND